ncbi:flavin-binding monooxygenase-like protein [Niveomyces insectorum RCEF 264]|uniref:Flavin-binding monooxygenase-like protein n=1 Tax=Niveomyces insectorum RCEF 264 TaxID=1081102 RepID=A0A167P1Q8_9HYPO|nr:flavin-binding monooxygenase-like protein [Niveomyces insectorum RCEF 264]
MENPAKEIKGVILSLCTSSQAEQEAAISKYFLPNASFVHPLCRVPSFSKSALQQHLPRPLGHATDVAGIRLDSRRLICSIFRWYKILSPHIVLGVDSVAWDKTRNILYVGLHQRFAVWFIPLYAANVRLVTEIKLVPVIDGEGVNSYAAVAAVAPNHADTSTNTPGTSSGHTSNTSRGRGRGQPLVNGASSGNDDNSNSRNSAVPAASAALATAATPHPPQTRYYIARQEDHYQINELVKFFTFGFGSTLWTLVQLLVTGFCFAAVLVVDTSFGLIRGGSKRVTK